MSIAAEVKAFVDATPPGSFLDVNEAPGVGAARDAAMSRLASARADVVSVRKGLYWKAPVSRFGPVPADPIRVAMRVLSDRGVGLTGWAASNHLGLSSQVPARTDLVAVGRVPKGLAGVRVHSRSNIYRLGLNPEEVAALEVLRAMPGYTESDLDTTTARFAELARSGDIRPTAVDMAVRHEHRAGVGERWGKIRRALIAS